MIGTTVSSFNITAKLGEGGMGEVYRAEDTKLGRQVAIKVLPDAVASDPERMARFERDYLEGQLARHGGNFSRAAAAAGLYRWAALRLNESG